MGSAGTGHPRRWVLLKGRLVASAASAFVMAVTGVGWTGYHTALGRIIISHALPNGAMSLGDNQNILLMGLDSRLDQNGRRCRRKSTTRCTPATKARRLQRQCPYHRSSFGW